MEAHGRYDGLSAWIGVAGQAATVYRPGSTDAPTDDALGDWDPENEQHGSTSDQLCRLLSGHGIECAISSYPGSHDFTSAANGLAAALPWVAGKIGTPGVAREQLPCFLKLPNQPGCAEQR